MIGLFTAKQFFRYTMMPEFVSRIRGLTTGGFSNVAYLIAVIYNMVRLLPDRHPYLDGRNIGRFGIRHVIAEAANNLVISRKNIDQIILFVVILIGMIMFALQFIMLGAYAFMHTANAAPPAWADSWLDFFVVPNAGPGFARSQDIAYIMLDLVFGVPWPGPGLVGPLGQMSFFESCVGMPLRPCLDTYGLPIGDPNYGTITVAPPPTATLGPLTSATLFPFPIHLGLHALFGLYNIGLLIVAAMITCYFIATVIAETAQSGTPFGKRFNKFWAPIRIVVAFGLLMPIGGVLVAGAGFGLFGMGLNSAQYLVLYSAKYGSALATNGWRQFGNTLTTNYMIASTNAAISRPTAPEMEPVSLFMWLVNVCYHIDSFQRTPPFTPIGAFIIGRQNKTPSNVLQITTTTTLDAALAFLDPGAKFITIRFGLRDQAEYPDEDGYVKPICGEIQLPLTDPRRLVNGAQLGVYTMQEFYFLLIREMWYENSGTSPYAAAHLALGGDLRSRAFAHNGLYQRYENATYDDPLTNSYVSIVNNTIRVSTNTAITAAVTAQINDPSWNTINPPAPFGGPCTSIANSPLQNKGWGAAGIWYNCIAELNGSMTTAVTAIPTPTLMPASMEQVLALKQAYDNVNTGPDMFLPTVSGVNDTAMLQKMTADNIASRILYEANRQWMAGAATSTTQVVRSSPFSSAVSAFLGTNGLYDLRQNVGTHPLAQLVGIGRALVEAATRKIGYAVATSFGAMAMNQAEGGAGSGAALMGVAASMLVTVAMLGLTAGFVLYYIVPFLPFIYFFFALGGWVKAIFEAMVGAPLWALAHIRIDGHGLPGNAAMNGYFLIFEIFVRPILTLFGLLASVSIFAGLVAALNGIFDLVVYNVSGFNINQEITGPAADSVIASMRSTIDEFFFTIIYAVIVYMMAMSSFKLIDQIPNNILRWMGQSVPTFGDTREDPAQGLMGRATGGAQQAFGRLGSGLSGVVGSVSSMGGKK